MVPALAISLRVFCALLAPESPSDNLLTAYQDAKAHAQRDPKADIRLAMWCETHGLKDERLKHLAIALLADPNDLSARGLMGLVRYRESDRVQTVFNLEVAEGHSFFVGTRGVLVHDNSLVLPATEPFDSSPDLQASMALKETTSPAAR